MEPITRKEKYLAAIVGQAVELPDPITREEMFLAEIANNGTGGSSIEPAEEDIPKVFFGAALPQTKDDLVMSFRYISKTEDIKGFCKTKAQGNSSMNYPKKNQTVKLYKDADCAEKLEVDFKGWGKQNKFCFKANWIDLTHARNIVSARLWGDVVKSRADYDTLPEDLRTSPNQGAVDGFPVKVYAGGIYQGRYTLNIPKDAWMANMDDELDTHCILCGENYVSGCFRAEANIDGSDWTDEVHDTVPASIKTRWNQVINFVMTSTDDAFKANLGNYFNVPSLIDYYLFGLVSCGFDAFGKNQLYMTYDGQMWYATMYDMDSTWGMWWDGSKFLPFDYARTDFEDYTNNIGNLLYIRLESLFMDEIKERWEELKSGALSIDNIINRFERFTDIASPYLVAEDYASTTAGGAYTAIPQQNANNIQQLREYAADRVEWVCGYLEVVNLNDNVWEDGRFASGGTEHIDSPNYSFRNANYLPVEGGKTVVVEAFSPFMDNYGGPVPVQIVQYDSNKNVIGSRQDLKPCRYNETTTSWTPNAVTLNSETAFVRLCVYYSGPAVITKDNFTANLLYTEV